MSSAIPIPMTTTPQHRSSRPNAEEEEEEELAASPDSSLGPTPPSRSSLKSSSNNSSNKGKGRARDVREGSGTPTTPPPASRSEWSEWSEWELSPRRPSLLGSSLSQSSYTVVNLSGGGAYSSSEGPTRLVTCIKSSQGFDWNQELFLPASYATSDYDSLELQHRPDPVREIRLTEEEAEAILPQQ
ncbi:Hypothetical predicted protein [Lecanosticta acicola]|uniref:Uncharacterized protein n=1 Tax=Lecanosticta acicola TaxID=111012 RepID=A0AAI9EBA4_9PEZI|nr:Hypothetical predicted protein [Lecanosticta acicola]